MDMAQDLITPYDVLQFLNNPQDLEDNITPFLLNKQKIDNLVSQLEINSQYFTKEDLNYLEELALYFLRQQVVDYSHIALRLLNLYQYLIQNPNPTLSKELMEDKEYYQTKYYYYQLRLLAAKFWQHAILERHPDYLLFFKLWSQNIKQLEEHSKKVISESTDSEQGPEQDHSTNIYKYSLADLGILSSEQVNVLKMSILTLGETTYESLLQKYDPTITNTAQSHYIIAHHPTTSIPYILVYIPLTQEYTDKIKQALDLINQQQQNEESQDFVKIPFSALNVCFFSLKALKKYILTTTSDSNITSINYLMKWVPLKQILFSGPALANKIPLTTEIVRLSNILFLPHESLTVSSLHLQSLPLDSSFNTELPTLSLFKDEQDFDVNFELLQKNTQHRLKQLINSGMMAALLGLTPSSTYENYIQQKIKEYQNQAPTISIDTSQEKQDKNAIQMDSSNLNSIFEIYNNNYNVHQNLLNKMPVPLQAIAAVESTSGMNVKHATVKSGLNAGTQAIGLYGIMPLQALEIIKKDKTLKRHHGHLLNYHHKDNQLDIYKYIAERPHLEHQMAASHWNRLRRIFGGDEKKMAHAWYNGITGTLRASHKDIANHPYVQKFLHYKDRIQSQFNSQKAQKQKLIVESFKKSELYSIATNLNYYYFVLNEGLSYLTTDYESKIAKKHAESINLAIKRRHVYTLGLADGEILKHALIIGNKPSNLWLIKFITSESDDTLYDITNTPNKLLREHYFNTIARMIFDLGEYVPYSILGYISNHDGTKKQPVVAIKYYTGDFKDAYSLEKAGNIQYWSTMKFLLQKGVLHQLALMLYVLSDYDSHAHNTLVDPTNNKLILIDHEYGFDVDDEHTDRYYIPYILRCFRRRKAQLGSAYQHEIPLDEYGLPLIESTYILNNLNNWLAQLNKIQLMEILNILGVTPMAVIKRLELAQNKLLEQPKQTIDKIINDIWVKEVGPEPIDS